VIQTLLSEAKQLGNNAVLACSAAFLAGSTVLTLGLLEIKNTNLGELLEDYNIAKRNPTSKLEEEEKNLKSLLPQQKAPATKKEYTDRANTIGLQIQALQKSLKLEENPKLEYLLGKSVQAGILHPLEANQILTEYTLLASTPSSKWN
jgi:hypothetical protein